MIQIAGLHIPSFSTWAQLTGSSLKIAVNNGYCFAGNAALFGCSDFRIATKTSWIGMAGPAMIEGGGLGVFEPTDIGPVSVHEQNGVVDYVADNEEDATLIAKNSLLIFKALSANFQSRIKKFFVISCLRTGVIPMRFEILSIQWLMKIVFWSSGKTSVKVL